MPENNPYKDLFNGDSTLEDYLKVRRKIPKENKELLLEAFNNRGSTHKEKQEEIYRIRRQKAGKALKFLGLLGIEVVKQAGLIPLQLLAGVAGLAFSGGNNEDEEDDCEQIVLDSIKKSPVSDETKKEATRLFECMKDKGPDNCPLNESSEEARKTLVDAFNSCKLK